jgi:hypothetical protein
LHFKKRIINNYDVIGKRKTNYQKEEEIDILL